MDSLRRTGQLIPPGGRRRRPRQDSHERLGGHSTRHRPSSSPSTLACGDILRDRYCKAPTCTPDADLLSSSNNKEDLTRGSSTPKTKELIATGISSLRITSSSSSAPNPFVSLQSLYDDNNSNNGNNNQSLPATAIETLRNQIQKLVSI